MEKLLARDVSCFQEKNISFNILLKIHKTYTKLEENVTRGQNVWIKSTNLPESKVTDFWIISLADAKYFGH